MQITLKYFGKIAEIVGSHESIDNSLANLPIRDFKDKIEKVYPRLKTISYKIALNQNLVEASTIINNGDELALLPPFAGG